jgi:hypothetical protein
MNESMKIKCEQFEAIGLDAERVGGAELAAALDHASVCARCAALQDSWQAALVELRGFKDATEDAEAPPRVEMRVLQAFRTQRQAAKKRRVTMLAAWTLGAAAVLIGAVSWRNWSSTPHSEAKVHHAAGATGSGVIRNSVATANVNPPEESAEPAHAADQVTKRQRAATRKSVPPKTSSTNRDESDFTMLPGSLASAGNDGAIVRVRMQRGALGVLGLPVNEERAAEWIQVDLLVGNDGLPQAVRLRR